MILSSILNGDVINHTKEGRLIQEITNNNLLEMIYEQHGYGFQDGGCLMFAELIKKVMIDLNFEAKLFTVGRKNILDHFIIKTSSRYGDIYIDSEGIYTGDEVINKMYELELFSLCSKEDIVLEEFQLGKNINQIEFNSNTLDELYNISKNKFAYIINL